MGKRSRPRTARRNAARDALRKLRREADQIRGLDPASDELLDALDELGLHGGADMGPHDPPGWVYEHLDDPTFLAVEPNGPTGMRRLKREGWVHPLSCGVILLAWERPWNYLGHHADLRQTLDPGLLVKTCEVADIWLALLNISPGMIVFDALPGFRESRSLQ